MTVAEYLAAQVLELVDAVFCVTGGASMYLTEAFAGSLIHCHHEQACAMAAESYSRLRGFGVCMTTSGPGATNAITGVLGAWQDSIPMMVISGNLRTVFIDPQGTRQLGEQGGDIVSMIRPITKYAITIMDAADTPTILEKAIREAKTGRPGPVWIDVPLDIQCTNI
jgi:acetolactate synthase-1/2/3 large subunit